MGPAGAPSLIVPLVLMYLMANLEMHIHKTPITGLFCLLRARTFISQAVVNLNSNRIKCLAVILHTSTKPADFEE